VASIDRLDVPRINNADLHDIAQMVAESSDEEGEIHEDETDDDQLDVLETEHVLRHYWKGDDLKYM
jgi:hypothetical protein